LITTLAYTRIQRLIIQVTGSVAPTDREWDKYLDWLNTGGLDDVVRLVWTEGGEPSRAQRGHLRKLINDRHHPVAILCNQRLLIAEGPLLALIKFPVRAFPLDGLRDALDFLEVQRFRHAHIQSVLETTRSTIGDSERE
jgi:hypothetical protein